MFLDYSNKTLPCSWITQTKLFHVPGLLKQNSSMFLDYSNKSLPCSWITQTKLFHVPGLLKQNSSMFLDYSNKTLPCSWITQTLDGSPPHTPCRRRTGGNFLIITVTLKHCWARSAQRWSRKLLHTLTPTEWRRLLDLVRQKNYYSAPLWVRLRFRKNLATWLFPYVAISFNFRVLILPWTIIRQIRRQWHDDDDDDSTKQWTW